MKHPLRAGSLLSALSQTSAFVRKELVELVRRPRLVLTLVVGPFLLLVLFGNSYRQQGARLTTRFVGPEEGAYQDAVLRYRDSLEQYVVVKGYTSDRAAAEQELARGAVDLVVVFPDDAADEVLAGRQAEVTVLNDKLDPVQRAAVEIAARLAVLEMNASIVSSVVAEAQQAQQPADALLGAAGSAAEALSQAAASRDPRAVDQRADAGDAALRDLRAAVAATVRVLDGVGGPGADDRRARAEELDASLRRIEAMIDDTRSARDDPAVAQRRAAEVVREVDALRPKLRAAGTVDSAVLVRPFVAHTRTVLPAPIGATEFFAPSSIALLLQHLALSFAALSIVRDRSLGLFDVYRVAPTSSLAVSAGRFVAFTIAGVAVGGALLTAVNRFLDVPVLGSVPWMWAAVVLLLLASIALGMVVALISGSDSEVVQYAMLVLLGSLFFGGFVLDLGLFEYPGRAVSWLLPVTFAIRMLQDVMLRGVRPSTNDLMALGGQLLVYGTLSVLLLRRRLRVS